MKLGGERNNTDSSSSKRLSTRRMLKSIISRTRDKIFWIRRSKRQRKESVNSKRSKGESKLSFRLLLNKN